MSNTNFVQRTECPACGSQSFNKAYSKKYNDPVLIKYLTDFYNKQGSIELEYLQDAEYTLLECKHCGLVFQEYIPDDSLMYKLYEQWIDPEQIKEKDKAKSFAYSQKYAAEIISIIGYFKKHPFGLSFFDFGMGWGKWSLMAKAFGVDSYGTELSDERINYAGNNGIKVITYEEIPEHSFDFINTEQVYEHIPAPLNTMKYLSRALKPEGLIKISVPNGDSIQSKLKAMDWNASRGAKNSLMVVAPLEHINCYTTRSVVEMAKACGMEQVNITDKYIGFLTYKDLLKNSFRPLYYKLFKAGSITLYFKKNKTVA